MRQPTVIFGKCLMMNMKRNKMETQKFEFNYSDDYYVLNFKMNNPTYNINTTDIMTTISKLMEHACMSEEFELTVKTKSQSQE